MTTQKKQNMFLNLEQRLLNIASRNYNKLRFCTIEYLCSFSNIDPFLMALSISISEVQIVFDDTSITAKENKRKQKILISMQKNKLGGAKK